MDETSLYCYRARYVKNYDGDTVTMDIDLGMGIWLRGQKLRLYGINTPEMRGGTDESKERAREAKNYVSRMLSGAQDILVETIKDKSGKYGRLLAVIWFRGLDKMEYENLNGALVEEGLAEKKSY